MSELVPSLIPLDKGLNLQTAKLVAPAGSVLDTLNYEQVDFQGQKRIDGFMRYDGQNGSAFDDYYKITLNEALPVSGDILLGVEAGPFGKLVSNGQDEDGGAVIYVSVIDNTRIPEVGDTLYHYLDGVPLANNTVVAIVKGSEDTVSVDTHYANLLLAQDAARSTTTELQGPVAGLHWFRDRLYAVAGVTVVSLNGTTPQIHPDDVLSGPELEEARVLDAITLPRTRLVFIDNTAGDAGWGVTGTEVERDGDSVGEVATGYQDFAALQDIATFYVSRSEIQAIDEEKNWGWEMVHQGWSVNFEDGLSLFGSLPSLNQNIIGLGVQGPTSTSATNGMPLILTQKVNISNDVVQVKGWKSSQTPETYELETDNFIEVDDDTIYADAYISWDGTTGEVVGITSPLVEYPATNTVIVEIP
jgi:hypothetical protein